ncbi:MULTISPECIES: YfcZ/YiiS family protein [Pasteurellaceae]|uniref:PF04175 family protein n=1 Tax=Pasteurella bettyae CCUG 2042 TaxID=1095749 RepID=I3DBS9_9PAST|nr:MULTISPECIES: DUF406 family protein [Pasteurellaceae]EIJ69172.1 PF04175 family protein [Pasteurella bettyae CCUG 2042]SUB22924.1 Protein of uncharacterised function (DUF406) [Pasteurella bettyae]
MKSDKPIECVGCNTFDVGSILNNDEVEAKVEKVFATKDQAEQALSQLIQKARDIESDPCTITSDISEVEAGYKLTASFVFSCQAESVIFQLALRSF